MDANENMLESQPKYYCEKCKYGCSKKSSWEQHLATNKHQTVKPLHTELQHKIYMCEKCNISFKHQSSYIRHKKMQTCIKNTEIQKDTEINNNLIASLLKQNIELMNFIIKTNPTSSIQPV